MSTDENLLFGVLALQADLIDAGRFAEACSAWAASRERSLADLLVARGWLSAEDRGDVEKLVRRKVNKHRGDVRASLAEITTDPVKNVLANVADDEVQRSLGHTPDSPSWSPSTTAHELERRGRYTLRYLHAQGGIGQVWLARDEHLGREVALKELRAERQDHATAKARFLEEARVTGQLEHPGIVPVHELVRGDDGSAFYTMRMVRGRTLSEAIKEYHAKRQERTAGPLELRTLLNAFMAVCNAVGYAHSRGVLHRDLKPANVVLGEYGEVVVLDWGLAKVIGQTEESNLLPVSLEAGLRDETVQGQVMGTPAYMAPEQAEGRVDQLGPHTDVYGLGAVLYQILTGKPPFEGGDTPTLLHRIVREEPPRPRQRVGDIPRPLEAVCLKALAKRASNRYSAAPELAREIERWLADEPVSAWREPMRVRITRRVRRRPALVTGLAVGMLLVVLFGGAGSVWWTGERQRQRAAAESSLERVEALLGQGRVEEARGIVEHLRARDSAALAERLRQAQADLEFVEELDRIRLWGEPGARARGAKVDPVDLQYAEAFAKIAVVPERDDASEVAQRLSRSPIRNSLLAGLDLWAVAAEHQRRAWLLSVARTLDPDPVRDRLRDPSLWSSHEQQVRVVANMDWANLTPALAQVLSMVVTDRPEKVRILLQTQTVYPADFWLNYRLAGVLGGKKDYRTAEGYARVAVAVRPRGASYGMLGWVLEQQGKIVEAEQAYRTSIDTDRRYSRGHIDLGHLLAGQKKYDEAEVSYRKGIDLEPDYAYAHAVMGELFLQQGRLPESEAAYRKATELDANLAVARVGVGFVLARQGRLPDAEKAYRRATQLAPGDANAHVGLGGVLGRLGRYPEAEKEYGKARTIDPKLAVAHEGFAEALRRQGKWSEAELSYRKAIEAGSKNPRLPAQVVLMGRHSALRAKLPEYLSGKLQPASNEERLTLALVCKFEKQPRMAMRYYFDAFAADPKLADDLTNAHRYDASGFAILAASDQGNTEGAEERSKLREQALTWLKSDLALWRKRLDGGKDADRAAVRQQMTRWQLDADLVSVRDDKALAALSARERGAWQQLWADVAALLKRAETR